MKALITGATGFIGYHVAKYLADKGVEALALVRAGRNCDALLAAGIVELKDIRVTAMILLPLLLSILLTAAFSVIVSMPLNYANVIVLPLLIGIGVHSGIMFMIRYLEEPPIDGNMTGTSAARAIFLSSLTMIISTGTLIFSNHRGIFSIGVLLTVCFALLLVSVLVLMPSLTKLFFVDRTK